MAEYSLLANSNGFHLQANATLGSTYDSLLGQSMVLNSLPQSAQQAAIAGSMAHDPLVGRECASCGHLYDYELERDPRGCRFDEVLV